MAKFFIQAVPGVNYKAIADNQDGQVWNPAPTAGPPLFEDWNPAHVQQYQITAAVDERGIVLGTVPAGIPDCEELTIRAVIIAAANLAISDFPAAAGYSDRWASGDWVRNAQTSAENGDGDLTITQDYGGTGAFQVIADDGVTPVDNAVIRAYVKSQYDAGVIDARPPTTFSGSDGNWIRPLNLDPDIYVFTVYNPITKITNTFSPVDIH